MVKMINTCEQAIGKLVSTSREIPGMAFVAFFLLGLQILSPSMVYAQGGSDEVVTESEDLSGSYVVALGECRIFDGSAAPIAASYDRVWIGIKHALKYSHGAYYTFASVYKAPPYVDIIDMHIKQDSSQVVILLDDGTLKLLDCKTGNVSDYGKGIPFLISAAWKQVGGDAVYALAFTFFAVTRDLGLTWQSDTAGLGSVNFNAFALDSSQHVYLATTGGIFKQHPDSSVWHKLTSFPENYANAIYVDSHNRIYAGTYYSSYMSTDGGTSWTSNSTGLLPGGLVKYGQDVFGNIYSIGGGAVYRSDSGTASWVRIDTPITNEIMDPTGENNNPYVNIGGDSIISLATTYGMFTSNDQGKTWDEDNSGMNAEMMYGYLKTSARQFLSTNLGLFYLNNGDSVWTKTFPVNGYATGNSIYADSSGMLYTLGSIISANNSQSPNANWKSTDNGTTWLPDTTGISSMAAGSNPKYFADESGVQHYAVSGIAVGCFMKTANSSWMPDTTGLSKFPQNFPNTFFSDQRGNLYLAVTTTTDYTGMLFRRPIGGGTWVADTAGLQKAIVYSISVDANGDLYAGTYGNGVFKKTGSTWKALPSPNGLQGNDVFATSVDKSGALFAGFAYQPTFNYLWQGIFYSTNDGSSWTYVGLDSISVRALIAYGDSVYAVTYNNGLYVLTKSGATGVRQKALTPNSFALYQNFPNPFNPSTVIGYQLAAASHVTLKMYDILGREVATLADEKENAGAHQTRFDGTRFASGVYLYRLEAKSKDGMSFISTKKLVLIK